MENKSEEYKTPSTKTVALEGHSHFLLEGSGDAGGEIPGQIED